MAYSGSQITELKVHALMGPLLSRSFADKIPFIPVGAPVTYRVEDLRLVRPKRLR